MSYLYAQWEAKLDHTLRARYAVSLMNNTKWREVWNIVCDLQLRVQMDYADAPNWSGSCTVWGPFTRNMLEERGIRDPGIGGPFLYKQILWLRVPREHPNDVDRFKAALSHLGVIPIIETEQYIEIRGYDIPPLRG